MFLPIYNIASFWYKVYVNELSYRVEGKEKSSTSGCIKRGRNETNRSMMKGRKDNGHAYSACHRERHQCVERLIVARQNITIKHQSECLVFYGTFQIVWVSKRKTLCSTCSNTSALMKYNHQITMDTPLTPSKDNLFELRTSLSLCVRWKGSMRSSEVHRRASEKFRSIRSALELIIKRDQRKVLQENLNSWWNLSHRRENSRIGRGERFC